MKNHKNKDCENTENHDVLHTINRYWHAIINRLSEKNVEDLLSILKSTNSGLNDINPELLSEEYNRQMILGYVI
ncbi:CLUMA_CG014793, isoform A [Clunio marinus]|uniref:CLUMA_CG014793, isoform A n=1 Tax=Clunio marinus TaxID=568069 RepID=A0A1J1IR32_9DIPT|nr:CLUMA_CG014793, isoform A [Clunio marinus]